MYVNKITANGVSTTKMPGQEQYRKLNNGLKGIRRKTYFQYDYRDFNGELFSCVKPTLEACRAARDAWLDKKIKKSEATI